MLKTNPFIRIDNEFNIVDIVHNERYGIANLKLIPFFDHMTTWRARSDCHEKLCDLTNATAEEADEMIDDFVNADLLISSGSTPDILFKQSREWVKSNAREELDYYLTVSDSMESTEASSGRMWIKRAWEGEEIPDNYKTYEDSEIIRLEEPEAIETISFEEEFQLSSPSDSSNDESITKEELSDLLYLSFGEIDELNVPNITKFIKRTSPSGGGRHPTEVYIGVQEVDGIPGGIYHYSVKEHGLEAVSDAEIDSIADYTPSLDNTDAKFVVLFSSRIERNMMKYKFNRCYTVINQDIGHLIQTLRILSRMMGQSCQPMYDIDASIHDLFEFSYYEEPILYGAVVR